VLVKLSAELRLLLGCHIRHISPKRSPEGLHAAGRPSPQQTRRAPIVVTVTTKAWLEGHPADLAALARLPALGDVRVVLEDDRYYLTAPEIDNPPEPGHFNVPAQRLIDLINGLARTQDPNYRPVSLTGHFNGDDGSATVCVPVAHLEARATLTADAVVLGPDGKPKPQPPSPLPDRFTLADTNSDVAEALKIMGGAYELGWVDLYKIHEIIRHAIPLSDMIARGWTSKAADSAFTASANRADVSGAYARHARNRGGVPANTMSIAQARSYISDLVAKWLGNLAGS
jgi:hypothetical protein